ncbi:unnamed protein product [Gordionus sp. m RMFG-2023]|uniref:rho GTPase-activating protein gacF-like n=1 Tax=Gordionus sp. m RMFG-2023 TaxID=3053472 RepID=UPI0030E0E339
MVKYKCESFRKRSRHGGEGDRINIYPSPNLSKSCGHLPTFRKSWAFLVSQANPLSVFKKMDKEKDRYHKMATNKASSHNVSSWLWTPLGHSTWKYITGMCINLTEIYQCQVFEYEFPILQSVALKRLHEWDLCRDLSFQYNVKTPTVLKLHKIGQNHFPKIFHASNFSLPDLLGFKKKNRNLVFGIPIYKAIQHDQRFFYDSRSKARNKSQSPIRQLSLELRRDPTEKKQFGVTRGFIEYNDNINIHNDLSNHELPLLIPVFVENCLKYLESRCLYVQGIFRVSCSKKRMKQLKEDINCGKKVYLNDNPSPHDIAGLLKEYFRELPEPLMTDELHQSFLATRSIENDRAQIKILNYLLCLLPPTNRNTLEALMLFLHKITLHSDDVVRDDGHIIYGNKMDARNLALIFGPNILHSYRLQKVDVGEYNDELMEDRKLAIKVVQFMIENVELLFKIEIDLLNEMYLNLYNCNPRLLDYSFDQRYKSLIKAEEDRLLDGEDEEEKDLYDLNRNTLPSKYSDYIDRKRPDFLSYQYTTPRRQKCRSRSSSMRKQIKEYFKPDKLRHSSNSSYDNDKNQNDKFASHDNTNSIASHLRYNDPRLVVSPRESPSSFTEFSFNTDTSTTTTYHTEDEINCIKNPLRQQNRLHSPPIMPKTLYDKFISCNEKLRDIHKEDGESAYSSYDNILSEKNEKLLESRISPSENENLLRYQNRDLIMPELKHYKKNSQNSVDIVKKNQRNMRSDKFANYHSGSKFQSLRIIKEVENENGLKCNKYTFENDNLISNNKYSPAKCDSCGGMIIPNISSNNKTIFKNQYSNLAFTKTHLYDSTTHYYLPHLNIPQRSKTLFNNYTINQGLSRTCTISTSGLTNQNALTRRNSSNHSSSSSFHLQNKNPAITFNDKSKNKKIVGYDNQNYINKQKNISDSKLYKPPSPSHNLLTFTTKKMARRYSSPNASLNNTTSKDYRYLKPPIYLSPSRSPSSNMSSSTCLSQGYESGGLSSSGREIFNKGKRIQNKINTDLTQSLNTKSNLAQGQIDDKTLHKANKHRLNFSSTQYNYITTDLRLKYKSFQPISHTESIPKIFISLPITDPQDAHKMKESSLSLSSKTNHPSENSCNYISGKLFDCLSRPLNPLTFKPLTKNWQKSKNVTKLTSFYDDHDRIQPQNSTNTYQVANHELVNSLHFIDPLFNFKVLDHTNKINPIAKNPHYCECHSELNGNNAKIQKRKSIKRRNTLVNQNKSINFGEKIDPSLRNEELVQTNPRASLTSSNIEPRLRDVTLLIIDTDTPKGEDSVETVKNSVIISLGKKETIV